jgi:hypothetical protein
MEAVIDPSGPAIVGQVPPGSCRHGGPWADFVTVPIPDELKDKPLKVSLVDDAYVLTLDADTETANQWTQVRAQQRQKLYESDWTCSVTDYEVPNKADWVTYRQALRDVTRGSAPPGTEGSLAQTDPFNIVWPPAPEA